MDTTGHRRTPTDHGDKTQDQQTFPSPNERLVFFFFMTTYSDQEPDP